jgi:aminopeptidase
MRPVQDWRIQKTKGVILRWPSGGFVQQVKMSGDEFAEFFFEVCTMDYSKMEAGMGSLKRHMESGNEVKIAGNGIDLSFSIKDIPAILCGGYDNIPDGEVFTTPLKNSVNGTIQYNRPIVYQGIRFEYIRREFKDDKIIAGDAGNKRDALKKILNADGGGRYVGEFAFGFNSHILNPMYDILFDEKIAGSFHSTPGQAYEGADNGNRSQIRWDLVCVQRREHSGGEIYFDGELTPRDGLFILTECQDSTQKM